MRFGKVAVFITPSGERCVTSLCESIRLHHRPLFWQYLMSSSQQLLEVRKQLDGVVVAPTRKDGRPARVVREWCVVKSSRTISVYVPKFSSLPDLID